MGLFGNKKKKEDVASSPPAATQEELVAMVRANKQVKYYEYGEDEDVLKQQDLKHLTKVLIGDAITQLLEPLWKNNRDLTCSLRPHLVLKAISSFNLPLLEAAYLLRRLLENAC